ncbi:MAG: cupin fold metalloprotein, WbuC family [Candidatus Parabeggiatoa sp. nov. 1]|nr:MAG: cupin fold metalloprotein, WbuC family [Gammaproteobacteria bacterium]
MSIEQISQEVYVEKAPIVKVAQKDIEYLKEKAILSERKRVRLCTHKDVEEPLHEMLIVLRKETYVRPHKHLHKSESFHIIEGLVDVVIFDDEGKIIEVIQMGDYASERRFYYRLSSPYYHIPFIISDYVVIHETTNGPFNRADTLFAPWTPEENDGEATNQFINQLAEKIKKFNLNSLC